MKNAYTELLEQIITEMKAALQGRNPGIFDSDYRQWLDFLRQVNPGSVLLKKDHAQQALPVPNARADSTQYIQSDNELKDYSDLREIIRFAASREHPTWYIQPHFTGSSVQLTYENGELKDVREGVPRKVSGFSGIISGAWLDDEMSFIACDLDNNMGFLQKMEFLKNVGFTIPDFVLFPTDKLITVSTSKLETSLINFISTAQRFWAKVDGVVIVSDAPLFSGDNGVNSKRIIFKPNISLTL